MTEETNQWKIELFKSVFRGRRDAYGAGKGQCVNAELTDSVILRHLAGVKRIGQYPLSPEILDGSGTFWAVVDMDADNLNAAIEVVANLHALGISGYLERSKSKGYHIWTFFREAVDAKAARALMHYALDGNGHEIFPKQSTIKKRRGYGYGNYVNLPLFGVDVKKGKTVFLASERGYKPREDQWSFLEFIERVSLEQINDLIEIGELQLVEDTAAYEDPVGDTVFEEYSDMMPCVAPMMQGVSKGCRDEVAFTLAKHFRVEKKLPQDATYAILMNWNRRNRPPLSDKAITEKVKSAYEGRDGGGYTGFGCGNQLLKPFCVVEGCPVFRKSKGSTMQGLTGTLNPYFRERAFIPSRLADELMNEHPFAFSSGQLYVYSDGVYMPMGRDFIRTRSREKLGEDSRINRINEVIAHITDLSRVELDRLNTHREFINVSNGMLCWSSGELLDHGKEYMSTIRISVKYDPNADCPQIRRFFETTLPSDCIQLIEELFGYCLIPDTRYEKAFMLKGEEENGKSTFLNLLERFVGSTNVSKVPLQDLSEHRFMRAELFGRLVNMFADLDARSLKSTSFFKTVVSGDPITAERKNQDPFTFRPFSRLIYSANEIPRSPDWSPAYYRRWAIVDFPNRFQKGVNADENLVDRLLNPSELSGLLNLALRGLRRLFDNGCFTENETTRQTLEEYRKQNDTVSAFMIDECESDPEARIKRTELYNSYMRYCEREGFRYESRSKCYARVTAQAVSTRKTSGDLYFTGIRLKRS